MKPDEKLSRLEKLFSVANEGFVTAKEVADAFVQVLRSVQETVVSIFAKIEAVDENAQIGLSEANKRITDVSDSILRERKEIEDSVEAKIAAIQLLKGDPGEDADPEDVKRRVLAEIHIPDPIPGSSDTPEQVRDKLESLAPGQRFSAEFIDGLKAFIEANFPRNGGVRVIGGRAGVQMYIDGAKVGLVQTLNLLAGTGINFTYLNKNGVLTLTVNSSGGAGGTWYLGEQITLGGDSMSFTLLHAPTAKLEVLLDRQPQIQGVDITGTIDGVNKNFAFTSVVDPSLLTLIYANYL